MANNESLRKSNSQQRTSSNPVGSDSSPSPRTRRRPRTTKPSAAISEPVDQRRLAALLTDMEAVRIKARQQEREQKLAKMKLFLEKCQGNKDLPINLSILKKMTLALSKLEAGQPLAFDRWSDQIAAAQSSQFLNKFHRLLKPRGRVMKKAIRHHTEPAPAPTTTVDNEEEERARLWRQLARRQVPKVARILIQNTVAKQSVARRLAIMCSKEQNKFMAKLQRTENRDIVTRSRRAMKEMLQFWKRNEKEERELRKRAEKEAAERRKQEEEEREARRQHKKLQFLLTQTELYSHFIARKGGAVPGAMPIGEKAENAITTATPFHAGIDFADLDDSAITQHAQMMAASAVAAEREKLRKFDAESDHHRKEAGAGKSTIGEELDRSFDLTMPSTLASAQIEVRQPRMLQCQLKSYQLKGLTWLANLYEQGINGILADEMGLGKTVQAISLMAYLAETHNIWGPFLVIAPASTLHNWQQELSKFVPTIRALPYWGNVKDRTTLRRFWGTKRLYTKDSPFHVLITSYQLVVADEKYFQRVKWQYMVLDEAQAIKSSSSVRWKTLLSFPCRNRLLLTGTPIQNSMQELWALLHFIMPGLFDSHDEFSDWFAKDIESHAMAMEARTGASTLSAHQIQRLHIILKPFMLRRVKKDVEEELGAKIENDVICQLTGRQRSLYRAIRDKLPTAELLALFSGGGTNTLANTSQADTLMNIVMQFRKVCNHPELFERTETTSPFVLHNMDAIRPTSAPAPLANRVIPLTNPLSIRVPKLALLPNRQTRFLEFEASIYHPCFIQECWERADDPFAVTYFTDVLCREDIPMLMKRGLLGLVEQVERKQGARYDCYMNYLEMSSTFLVEDRLTRMGNEIVSDSLQFFLRGPSMFVPSAVTSPATLVVDDINYMMAADIRLPQDLPIRPTLYHGEHDEASGRDILMPNLAKFISDSGKMVALDKLLKELKEGGHRVLIYNQMTRMIDLMEDYLQFRGYTYIRLDGSSKIADRRDLVSDWQARPDIFIFLLSTRAGGLGINLTAADTVIFYDSDWNPTVDQQAMDRAHRLGQTKQVTVYRLITRNSIEERMRQRAKQKDEIHRVVIAGGEFKELEAIKPNQKDIASLLLEEQDETTPVIFKSTTLPQNGDSASPLIKRTKLT